MSDQKIKQGTLWEDQGVDLSSFNADDWRRFIEARRRSEKEGARARAWRESVGLSRRELAEKTGYGERTIAAFEAGEFGPGKPIDERTMLTYRLACASIAVGVDFNWTNATLSLGQSKITVSNLIKDSSEDIDILSEAADFAITLNGIVRQLDDERIISLTDAVLLEIGRKLAYKHSGK